MTLAQLERQWAIAPEPDREITEQDVAQELANAAMYQPWLDSAEAFFFDENSGLSVLAKMSLGRAIINPSPSNSLILGEFFRTVFMQHFERVAINNIREEMASHD